MHKLQSKHSKLKKEEVEKILEKYNISISQLPKISKKDPSIILENYETGDVMKIERKNEDGVEEYLRVVI